MSINSLPSTISLIESKLSFASCNGFPDAGHSISRGARQLCSRLRLTPLFIAGVGLAYGLEVLVDRFSAPSVPETGSFLNQPLFNWQQGYQRTVTSWGHLELVPRDVSLVVISKNNEPRFSDPCAQRHLLGALLDALKDSPAKVIVVDKVFEGDLDCHELGQLPEQDPTRESSVPEPVTYATLAAGLIGFACLLRRKPNRAIQKSLGAAPTHRR